MKLSHKLKRFEEIAKRISRAMTRNSANIYNSFVTDEDESIMLQVITQTASSLGTYDISKSFEIYFAKSVILKVIRKALDLHSQMYVSIVTELTPLVRYIAGDRIIVCYVRALLSPATCLLSEDPLCRYIAKMLYEKKSIPWQKFHESVRQL